LSREDFAFDTGRNLYVCPQGKLLHTTGRVHDGRTLLYYGVKSGPRTSPAQLFRIMSSQVRIQSACNNLHPKTGGGSASAKAPLNGRPEARE
jgi:hypothetical protein